MRSSHMLVKFLKCIPLPCVCVAVVCGQQWTLPVGFMSLILISFHQTYCVCFERGRFAAYEALMIPLLRHTSECVVLG